MAKRGGQGSNLADLAQHLVQDGPHKVIETSRRVRVIYNHTYIVDTIRALMVWEHPYYPQYYIPHSDIQNCQLKDKQEVQDNGKVAAAVVEVTVPGQSGLEPRSTDRVIRFSDSEELKSLAGMVRLEFGAMDKWLEEDAPIFVHPKDPFKRVDILPSQRSIEVKVMGKTVAKASTAMHLFETGLPPRYYLPLAAVDQSVLRQSDTVTKCPYKGEAEYYHVVVDGQETRDIVWYYRLPTHECAAIAGLVCFYNEKVDILLDGNLLEHPKTPFS